MKLEDCKPGVRVRVYDYPKSVYCGFINNVVHDVVFVAKDYETQTNAYHPQQLRKIVPKKGKPEVIVAVFNDGWQAFSKNIDIAEIEELKKTWASVWLMRGVKKL